MILIINNDNSRLCYDNRWRSFANFGCYSECVKVYKRLSSAQKWAAKVKGKVVKLTEGVTVEAGGSIYDSNGQRSWDEFIV